MTLLPGTQVIARGAPWEVVYVEPAGAGQDRFRLRSLLPALRGQEMDILAPFETVEPISNELDPVRAGRLRAWRLYHQAFLLDQALGPGALAAVDPGRLDIAPYQLVPVMRALRMSRPRLLLADGVGLGKTVEAGLVMVELIARRRAHRILIVSPAGPLLNQWHREMRTRFGLRFDVLKDQAGLQEARRSLVLGANPFDHVSLCLTSIDFAKQEKVLQDLERTTWDLVVLDEAHHCIRMGTAGDREDSQRRRLAEVLARQCDGLLLLTATPHDGYDPHFSSIIELLDPSLLDGRGNLRGDAWRDHVVRRLKRHIRDPKTGSEMFPERVVHPIQVGFKPGTHPSFSELQRGLLALVAPRLRTAIRQKRFGDVLAFVSLLKRSVSSVTACASTLRHIAARFDELLKKGTEDQQERRERLRTLRDYRRRLERYGALTWEEEVDQAMLEAEDMAAELLAAEAPSRYGEPDDVVDLDEARREFRREGDRLRRLSGTREALERLIQEADRAQTEDPKISSLVAEIEVIREAEPHANVLVYTEYTDSQDAIVAALRQAVEMGRLSGEILSLSGPDPDAVRTRITDRFGQVDDLVLVSTDASAEGLNLHQRCHHLVHLELPYNPNRLEQRNGRIDRYGQKSAPQVRYLYLSGTFEERLLLRLIAKYERQRARLTFVPDTLGVITSGDGSTVQSLLDGLAGEEDRLFESLPKPIRFGVEEEDTTSPAYGDLLAEVDKAILGFEKVAKSRVWLGQEGLAAESRLQDEASNAMKAGRRLSSVDLLDFVCEALESETGARSYQVDSTGRIRTLQLPPSWTFGLDGLPGWEAEAKELRLTADRNLLEDPAGKPVGCIGRAHPIVRRALDRVRNLQHGAPGAPLDRRVSAALVDDAEPALLFTFLATVQSGAGREYERVLAARVDATGRIRVFDDPTSWEPLASKAATTADAWKRHFAEWGMGHLAATTAAVKTAFERSSSDYASRQRTNLGEERKDLTSWLRQRATDLTGDYQPAQIGLFASNTDTGPSWSSILDPIDRLAAFAQDGSNPPVRRREAEGIIQLFRVREKDLASRAHLTVPPPVLLGLLMLVPTPKGK